MFLVDTLMFPKNNFVLRLFKDFKEERHSSSIFFFILSTKQASHFSHLWRSWELIGIWSIRLQHFVRIFWALTLLCHFVTIFLVCSCIRKCMSFLDSVSFNYHFSSGFPCVSPIFTYHRLTGDNEIFFRWLKSKQWKIV